MKIAVIGSTMMDVVSYTDTVPEAGETRAAKGFHVACGGKGANQAVAAAKLGADVLMVTAVGSDIFGKEARENFTKHGIETKYVKTAAGVANGVATILVEASSQNRILIHAGANETLSPEDIAAAGDDLAKCGLIVLQLEVPLQTVYAAIDFGCSHNIPVLLNPAPATTELSREMVKKCTYFVPNETELAILTGMPTGTLEEVKKAAKTLLAEGLKNIIVTMGGRGSLYMTENEEMIIPCRKVAAVDTTGAGDAYIGCFAASLAAGMEVKDALARASLYASLSVTRKGTQDSYAEPEVFADFCRQEQ